VVNQLIKSASQSLVGLAFAILLGAAGQPAEALSPDTAPPTLTQDLQALDTAASQENLQGVLQYYSPNFLHADGLTKSDLEKALTDFWNRYSNLTYTTQLLSWEQTDQGITAELQTRIQGTEVLDDRELALNTTLNTREYWQNDQIVRQEVLTEHSQIQTGKEPPTLEVLLPDEIKVNSSFNFDVIVKEPLDDDLLLGAVSDEPVRSNGFFNPTQLEVEPLTAGGLFKVGRAPAVRDDRWVSAVVVRKGGITMVTQRLRIVD
jgi:hypothetical protein